MTADKTPNSGRFQWFSSKLRGLYDWVVSWADSNYGLAALFFIALVESSVFLIPPDVLLLALALGAPQKSFRFAALCSLGSVLGALVGYLIGVFLSDTIGLWVVEFYGLNEKMAHVEVIYKENAFVALLMAGFTPIPFKVFTIASGMMKIPISTLLVASALSRTARFMLVASFVYCFGEKAKEIIDRYFDFLTIVVTVCTVGGFLLLKIL